MLDSLSLFGTQIFLLFFQIGQYPRLRQSMEIILGSFGIDAPNFSIAHCLMSIPKPIGFFVKIANITSITHSSRFQCLYDLMYVAAYANDANIKPYCLVAIA